MTSPYMIICNFLVVGIKAIPLVFAHIPIAKDFQFVIFCKSSTILPHFCVVGTIWKQGSTNSLNVKCSIFLHWIKVRTSKCSQLPCRCRKGPTSFGVVLAHGIVVAPSVVLVPNVVTCLTYDWSTQGGIQTNLPLSHPLLLLALHSFPLDVCWCD
jgi:hypothetical protein